MIKNMAGIVNHLTPRAEAATSVAATARRVFHALPITLENPTTAI